MEKVGQGINTQLAKDLPDRKSELKQKFGISDKLPHAWIADQSVVASNEYSGRLTTDIFNNAKELEPGVDWVEVTGTAKWSKSKGALMKGLPAIEARVSRLVGSVAREMGWDMDSPEIVYMSTYAFVRPLRKRIIELNENIKAVETGQRKFPSLEIGEQRVAAETTEAIRLEEYNNRLTEKVELFADEAWPGDEYYRKTLQALLRTGHTSTINQRKKALTQLKDGKPEESYKILSELKFKENDNIF